ncbi:helix-turn-helix domain-containing protein [Shouchella hunanensis]|uniref:Helix-turn-helix transcriptional regulator n=1 Tax=Shouchella hunanensis TaxID=766894 RepID=A0ABY7WCK5_9BACI|nr:helix-turn-helix transcriptional regulator [Shouchella hunanensis]WDF05517.1 helix-turn-helix transcriptional regulator [Shouchella hunanensis]
MLTLRKKKNWSQKDVVDLLKLRVGITISESYYGMIETGVRNPSLSVAVGLSELYKVNPATLFLEINTKKKTKA